MSSRRPSDPEGPLFGPVHPAVPEVVDGSLRFATASGLRFTVREELLAEHTERSDAPAPSGMGRGCLVFESDVISYRVYTYPSDWRTLPGDVLAALAVESRPHEPGPDGLEAPAVSDAGVVEFSDYSGQRWRVVEDACGRISDPHVRTRHCLVFTTALFVRRIYDYPAEWAALSSEELIALSEAA